MKVVLKKWRKFEYRSHEYFVGKKARSRRFFLHHVHAKVGQMKYRQDSLRQDYTILNTFQEEAAARHCLARDKIKTRLVISCTHCFLIFESDFSCATSCVIYVWKRATFCSSEYPQSFYYFLFFIRWSSNFLSGDDFQLPDLRTIFKRRDVGRINFSVVLSLILRIEIIV